MRLLFMVLVNLISLFFIYDCSVGDQINSSIDSKSISAAWFYLSDDVNYESIPAYWQNIHFNHVNRLYIGPVGIQNQYNFDLYKGINGDLSVRFKWLVERAKSDNPNIQIIVSQWWGDYPNVYGSSLDVLNNLDNQEVYAKSIIDFLESYQLNNNGLYSIDGYDIDYEGDNVSPNIKSLLTNIRTKLDQLSLKYHKKYYLTITPSSTQYINESSLLLKLDNVNMQSYEGGAQIPVDFYLQNGMNAKKIFFGICPETKCRYSKSVESVLAIYQKYNLGGIHLWRLNSDDYVYENSLQEIIFSYLNSMKKKS